MSPFTEGTLSGQEITTQPSTKGASTRTLRRWIEATREDLAETEDPRWTHLTFHDLRRTWATQLKGEKVDALLVCDWGGWDDLETFLEHYRGTYAPDVQKRERRKVEWLS
jgi:integrase